MSLEICQQYSTYGFCFENHDQLHKDCEFFTKFQICNKLKYGICKQFHRTLCVSWQSNGECQKENCQFLHKDCEEFKLSQECFNRSCQLYHRRQDDLQDDPQIEQIQQMIQTTNQFMSQNNNIQSIEHLRNQSNLYMMLQALLNQRRAQLISQQVQLNLDNLIVTFLFLNRVLQEAQIPQTGLKQEEIDQLIQNQNIQKQEICTICLDGYQENQEAIALQNCIHAFHKNCFIEWAKISKLCPVCKQNAI